jgi:hypothetical protein
VLIGGVAAEGHFSGMGHGLEGGVRIRPPIGCQEGEMDKSDPGESAKHSKINKIGREHFRFLLRAVRNLWNETFPVTAPCGW